MRSTFLNGRRQTAMRHRAKVSGGAGQHLIFTPVHCSGGTGKGTEANAGSQLGGKCAFCTTPPFFFLGLFCLLLCPSAYSEAMLACGWNGNKCQEFFPCDRSVFMSQEEHSERSAEEGKTEQLFQLQPNWANTTMAITSWIVFFFYHFNIFTNIYFTTF